MTERHDIIVTPEQKAKLEELRWARRQSGAVLVGDLVSRYAQGTPQIVPAAETPETVRVRAVTDDGVWAAAQKRAALENTTVSEVIRVMIDSIAVP